MTMITVTCLPMRGGGSWATEGDQRWCQPEKVERYWIGGLRIKLKFSLLKGGKTKTNWCCRGLAAILFVLAILLILAGVALYLDPKDGLQMFTPKFQDTNTTALAEEAVNVTVAESSTVKFESGVKTNELNSTISDAVNTTAETFNTAIGANDGDIKETVYPTSFGGWSTLASSSSSYGMK